MLVDISLKLDAKTVLSLIERKDIQKIWHVGTHIDLPGKEFPLEYTVRGAVIFNVENVFTEIGMDLCNLSHLKKGMAVLFYTGFIEHYGYGSEEYSKNHPYLSMDLIDALVNKGVSIIGVDFPGIRRPDEHNFIDDYCGKKGVFILENLCNLKEVIRGKTYRRFTLYTFPLRISSSDGVPCRAVALM